MNEFIEMVDEKVVYFPKNESPESCMDYHQGSGGFNTFGFVSFILTTVNAISVLLSNLNNRNNNNNNNNNDNNNNNNQFLESSIMTMQMAMRRKKKSIDGIALKIDELPPTIYILFKFWFKKFWCKTSECYKRNYCSMINETKEIGDLAEIMGESLG